MLVIIYYLILSGCAVIITCDSSYDYSATIDCLEEPLAPQYGGGLVESPEFDSGLAGWTVFGSGKIEKRRSCSGNNYLAAFDRKLPNDSFSHKFDIQKNLLYIFSAWVQLSEGKEIVSAFLEIPGNQHSLIVGSVIAKPGCWSMLKGGFTLYEDMRTQLYFLSNNTRAGIWIDSISLKQFTSEEWEEHQNMMIERIRKRRLRIHVTHWGKNLEGVNITITQIRPGFTIGCGSTEAILSNKAYQDWFTQRFQATTFGNEMKWYYTEAQLGIENYTVPDALVSFFRTRGIGIRGHNILWGNKNMTPYWAQTLPPRQLQKETIRHIGSVVSRYSGVLIAWDVMNENLHFSFYEDKLGPNASSVIYQIVRALDPEKPLFLNEYNTLEYPQDMDVIPSRYVEKIHEMKSFPGNENLNLQIGLEGHFTMRPNISYIRATLDVLGAMQTPIWITELDTRRGPNQVAELEEVMREVYSHPAVEGIIVWGGWKRTSCNQTCLTDKNYDILQKGCAEMCLVDGNLKSLPAGDVVDKLMKEWRTADVNGVTDEEGFLEQAVFLGEYSITCFHPMIPQPCRMKINVDKDEGPFDVKVNL